MLAHRLPAVALLLPSLLLVACPGAEPEPDPRIEALWSDPSACADAEWSWRADLDTGAVVDWQPAYMERFTADDLRAVQAEVGMRIDREVIYDVSVYQLRYVTQARGERMEATGIVAVPERGPRDPESFPLLAYLHGTTGMNDECAPSLGLDIFAAAALASFGHVVVAPDYLGLTGMGDPSTLLHPYLVAEPTAVASLDAVRAARRLLPELAEGVQADPGRLLILGGSQGGHAALFVDRFAPYYAPEEEIIAIAASVPPADVVRQGALGITEPVSATANTAAVLAGFADWYDRPLTEVLLPPYDAQVDTYVRTRCGVGGTVNGATTVEEVFTEDLLDAARGDFSVDAHPWSCIFRENSLVHTGVEPLKTTPTLFVLSENDTLVSSDIERGSFDTLCEQGLTLEYLECAGVDHTEGALGSLTEQLAFLEARWLGEPWDPATVCVRTAPVTCWGNQPAP